MTKGDTIKLKPINNRFKRLISLGHEKWKAINDPKPMPCFGGQLGVCAQSMKDNKVSNFMLKDVEA